MQFLFKNKEKILSKLIILLIDQIIQNFVNKLKRPWNHSS